MRPSELPAYKDLPVDERTGFRMSWGLFDKDGVKDEVGMFNLLTPEVKLNAAKEIKTGISVSLNWGIERMEKPFGARAALKHDFVDWRQNPKYRFYAFDDAISFNTQVGSQWDGLRHWGHTETGLYYNGIYHDDLLASKHLGLEHWSNFGGIVGRGVLLDYCSWAERNNIDFSPMSGHRIKFSDLQAIAKEANVTFQPGDILIVRMGWIKWFEEHGDEDRVKYVTNGRAWIGVEGSDELLEWLWDNHFAAIAGDSIGWEAWPPNPAFSEY